MNDKLQTLLESSNNINSYFISLPKYVQTAVNEHASEINTEEELHLFAETFMRDDSFKGA